MSEWHFVEKEKPEITKNEDSRSCSDWLVLLMPGGEIHTMGRYWKEGKVEGWEIYNPDWDETDDLVEEEFPAQWFDFPNGGK